MTVTRAFVTILLSGLSFAVVGATLGTTLGLILPGYYRAVFSSAREQWFDPVAVGLGLGLSQGLVLGVVTGAVVVLAVAWYNSRRRLGSEERYASTEVTGHSSQLVGERGITTPQVRP